MLLDVKPILAAVVALAPALPAAIGQESSKLVMPEPGSGIILIVPTWEPSTRVLPQPGGSALVVMSARSSTAVLPISVAPARHWRPSALPSRAAPACRNS
jgi:hypothetical protein